MFCIYNSIWSADLALPGSGSTQPKLNSAQCWTCPCWASIHSSHIIEKMSIWSWAEVRMYVCHNYELYNHRNVWTDICLGLNIVKIWKSTVLILFYDYVVHILPLLLLIINSWTRTHCLARSQAQHKRDQVYKSSPICGKQGCPEGVNAPLSRSWSSTRKQLIQYAFQELTIINDNKYHQLLTKLGRCGCFYFCLIG